MSCNTNSSIQSKINVIGSISGAQLTFEFTQASHGFRVGDVIRYDDAYAGFTLAQADTAEHAEVTGVVREISGDHIFLTTEGVIPIDGFTFARSADRSTSVSGYTASAYFLSGTTAGLLDTAPPTQGGYVVKPTVVNMGAIGGRQYGMIKNYVGNQIGGNASASVHGISPVGSIVPFIGYEHKVPAGFTTCAGDFISPSKYTAYNNHIGGKFGYKIKIGITGDTPYKRWKFMTDLNARLAEGSTSGTDASGRPRFRQEFPGTRQGNGVTSGTIVPGGNKVFVIQGDIAEVSAAGDQPDVNATSGGGPYYINVEITQDNQVDLPRILWAEKYGNETYVTTGGAIFGRQGLGDLGVSDYEIRSSFMANYNMEEAVDVFDGTDSTGLDGNSRTKIFRQDNTGSHGLDAAGGLRHDESVYNSYTQESPGHEEAYKGLHGNAAETPTPRNLNTARNDSDNGEYRNPYYPGTNVGGGDNNVLESVVNYDSHSPANEREIVSYISDTIGAPLPYFTATPSDDYNNNVRTYIITNNVSYDDLNKRVGGVNTNTDTSNAEYDDYFEIAQTGTANLKWVPSTDGRGGDAGVAANKTDQVNAMLLNTENAGTNGNKIDFISITGVRVPDLRDRYLKGKAEPAEFYGTTPLNIDTIEKDAYAVMNSYNGGVGLRGGTNRTHSQKLLAASHVASPATHTQEEHLMNWHETGIRSYDLDDESVDSGNTWYDIWAKPTDPGSDPNWSWAPTYRFREWWNWNSYGPTDDSGPWKQAKGLNVTPKSTGYNRIFGDDGLYNMSGFYQWNCDDNGNNCQNIIIPFNRDRYHRVDTPGIVTDTVSTPQVLRHEETLTPLDPNGNYDGLYVRDDMETHKDYQVIDRDARSELGTLLGAGVGAYNPVMSIDPLFIRQFESDTWTDPDWNDPGAWDDETGTFFGKDFKTFAYITNEPKYMTVNWLVRIEDDTSVALVDDTTFRKVNVDGVNDDGSTISSGSPLNLTNLPTSDPSVAGAVWNDGGTLKVSSG
jgi:hypothetical protein